VLEAVSLALLAATLTAAIAAPRLEAIVAVPAALALIAIGAIGVGEAGDELREVGPTLGFLAAMLVVAMACDREGLFVAAGSWMARGSRGDPVRLLALVFVAAALVTATLSLDTTVLLLTPVVIATVARLGLRPDPYSYAGVHLANSASLLLPISNLSNLLALDATGISFLRFAALMVLPWLAAIAVQWVVLRRAFAADLAVRPAASEEEVLASPRAAPVPRHVPAVLALALVAFAASSPLGVEPAWVALGAALALGVPALARGRASAGDVARSIGVPFLAFVAALAVIVEAVRDHGLQEAIAAVLPAGDGLPELLGVAAVAAVLANLVNNLPAILILLPIVSTGGPVVVLAALIGVNVGPNLTYVGSLATMLWRRVLRRHGEAPSALRFTGLGLVVVPTTLVAATVALWAAARVVP
jgi:arsenical pump membrane protein